MQLITFKMKEDGLRKLDNVVKEANFANRTEFIRSAIREKVNELERELAWRRFVKARGMFKDRPTFDEELERIRKEVFEELKKEFK